MAEGVEFFDVSLRGLKVAEKARYLPESDDVGFAEVPAPLPVGTVVHLQKVGGEPRAARVLHVVEKETGAESSPGMRVSFAAAAANGVSASKAAKAEASAAAPEPEEGPARDGEGGPAPEEPGAEDRSNGRRRRGRRRKKK